MSVNFTDRPKESYVSQQEAAVRAEAEAANAESLGKIKEQALQSWRSKTAKWRFMWNVRGQMFVAMIGAGIGGYFMVLPFAQNTVVDLLSYNRPSRPAAEALPTLSVAWWTNQWRKGVQTWRAGEYEEGFYQPICDYILDITGKDIRKPLKSHGFDPRNASRVVTAGTTGMLSVIASGAASSQAAASKTTTSAAAPATKMTVPAAASTQNPSPADRRSLDDLNWDTPKELPGIERKNTFVSKFAKDGTRPRALVPMCGDSPMVRHLADFGYNVDAVDGAEIAIRTLAETSEQLLSGWNEAVLHRIQLFCSDVFEPALWRALPKGGYDLIYDRQGLSAIDPEAREDYAFLLKKALKPDGVLYVEGTFRTKRVHRVRRGGPPFHFGHREISNLFPLNDGWVVKCREIRELQRSDLSAEDRVVGQVPKHLWVRHFPCVVRRDEAEAKAILESMAAKEFA